MQCSNCGSKVEKGWRHCPNCGIRIGGGYSREDMFSQVFREMEELTKSMGIRVEKDMEVIDLSQMLNEMVKSMGGASENGNRKGFSIRIHQKNDDAPKISFRKFGGGNEPAAAGRPEKRIVPRLRKPISGKQPNHRLGIKLPGETSEPETEIRRSGNKVLVAIKLPGVKAAGDIDINELESSVEIKALAGGKGYFKIIRKPEFSKIVGRKFEAGTLRLEIL
jgi:hypothetical protein